MFCPECGNEIIANAAFCGECDKNIVANAAFCSSCGKELVVNAVFCGECGKMINEINTQPIIKRDKKNNSGLVKAVLIIGGLILIFFILGRDINSVISNGPEGVAENFVESVADGDGNVAQNFCYQQDEATFLIGAVYMQITDFSSDGQIRHKPSSYDVTKETEDRAEVTVYDQDGRYTCCVELIKDDDQWLVTYVR